MRWFLVLIFVCTCAATIGMSWPPEPVLDLAPGMAEQITEETRPVFVRVHEASRIAVIQDHQQVLLLEVGPSAAFPRDVPIEVFENNGSQSFYLVAIPYDDFETPRSTGEYECPGGVFLSSCEEHCVTCQGMPCCLPPEG